MIDTDVASVPLLSSPLPVVFVDGCRYAVDYEGRKATDLDSGDAIRLYDILDTEGRTDAEAVG